MILAWRKIGRLSAFAALGLLLTDTAVAQKRGALSGIFSNVQLSPETGDLGGLEIELHTDGPDPYALVVFCEGWCNQAYRVPVKLGGSSFSFSFTEQLVDASGAPVADDHYTVKGRLAGRSLRVELLLNGNRWSAPLKRLKTRFGLDVARPPTDGPIVDPKQILR